MPTLQELESALLRAEAANDTAAARAIAQDMRSMMDASISANAPPLEVPPPSMLQQAREMLDIPDIVRGAGITTRGALPPAIGAIAGIPGGPAGVLAGSLAVPAAEFLTQATNLMLPEQYQIPSPALAVEGLLTKAGFPVPATTGERMIQAGGGALAGAGTQLPALAKLTGSAVSPVTREVANTLAQIPERQLAASAPAAMTGQATTELTGSPMLGLLAEVATSVPFGAGVRGADVAPSREMLEQLSNEAFRRTREAGIQIPVENWRTAVKKMKSNLSDAGWNPKTTPKLQSMFNELEKRQSVPGQPEIVRDFNSLEGYRKQIQQLQGDPDPTTRRFATALKDEFDSIIMDSPKEFFATPSSREGAQAWAEGMDLYARMKKADIFDDMLRAAELDKTKFSQSGSENSLAAQLRQLTKNQKRFRMFNQEERRAIEQAAKGGKTQNLLRFYGKFAPTSSIPAMLAGGAVATDAGAGLALTGGAIGARGAATSMREKAVQDLAAMMRAGGPVSDAVMYPAITAGRGLLSPYVPPQ
jgi:hypothetical protein